MLKNWWLNNFTKESSTFHLKSGFFITLGSLVYLLSQASSPLALALSKPVPFSWGESLLYPLGCWIAAVLFGKLHYNSGRVIWGQVHFFLAYFIPMSSLMVLGNLATEPLSAFIIRMGLAGIIIGSSIRGALYIEQGPSKMS